MNVLFSLPDDTKRMIFKDSSPGDTTKQSLLHAPIKAEYRDLL